MANDDRVRTAESDWPLTNPWPLLLVGLGAAAVAWVLSRAAPPGGWPLPRAALLLTALLAAGGGVSIRPRDALVVAGAMVVCFLTYLATDPEWDSARMMILVGTYVALVAAVVLALDNLLWPGVLWKVVVSVLILFHFGGISTAVTSVTPPSGVSPWIPNQLWTRVYRPYLQCAYLNNAYHFYSPEPGPATLIWARIEYTDGFSRWVKVPNRDEHYKDPLGQEYYRRLSLTESINQTIPIAMVPEPIKAAREHAGRIHKAGRIPLHPYLPENLQFQFPTMMSRKLLPSYARFLATANPHPFNPDAEVAGIKVYRIRHMMLQPPEVLHPDMQPLSKHLFHAYYQGEYDKDGRLKNPNDPFLYWLIPVIPVYEDELPRPGQPAFRIQAVPDFTKRRLVRHEDCLTLHAGSSPWGDES
jgi:hypothetical protein